MRSRLWSFAVPLIVVAAGTVMLVDTALQGQARGGAATPAAQAPAYRAPRTPDGKPNLNGIWQSMNEANWNIEAHSADFPRMWQMGAADAMPPGAGIVEGGPIPYLPAAAAKRKENFDKRATREGDPEIRCYLPGTPRAMYQNMPFQIIQSTDHIMMVFQFAGALRTIYMKPTPGPADSWMGWSNGKWEGETLVIDTKDFNGLAWFDRVGNFASEKLHVVERITAASPDHLNYEATIEDPQTFSRPWKISFPLYRRKEANARLLEFKCIEFSEEVVYGHLRKVPLN
jgi:hypothetical protein